MPQRNPHEPRLHQTGGFWRKRVRGRLQYLDRDDTVAKRKLNKLLSEYLAGKQAPARDWLDTPFTTLYDELPEDIRKLRRGFHLRANR